MSCRYDFEKNGASFDLTRFQLPLGQSYKLDDVVDTATETDDYTYEFNVCSDLRTLPVCRAPGACQEQRGGIGAAYQILENVRNHNGSCVFLGTASNATWSLLDETDGTTGVKLSYSNGAACSGGRLREFNMLFQCSKLNSVVPSTGVDEPTGCQYTVTFNSVYGCPTSCISGSTLCGNHGICAVDKGTNATHCYCNNGWGGEKCTDAQTSAGQAASPAAVLAGISLVLLVILLGLGVFLWYTIQKLKTEHSYGNFEQMVFEAESKDDPDDEEI